MKYRNNQIKASFLILIVTISVFIGCSFNYARAQTFNFDGNIKRSYVNFELIKNLIIIPLYIDGKGPYNFLLDTGVGPMIITDPSLMDTLKLENLRTMKLYGLGKGEEIDAFITQQLNVSIKEAKIENIPTAILKEDVFNLSGYVGKKIYGIIGYYFFNSFVVKVSYSNKRVSFISPLAKTRKKGIEIPLTIENKKPYIHVEMITPQQKKITAKMIVDCGASHAVFMEALDGKAFPLPDSTIIANLGVGLSGPISGHVGRIPQLTIGKYNFRDIIASFPAYEAVAGQIGYNTRNGNLGAEFLRRFDTIYDYQNSFMYLKPNQSYWQNFDHDMSGIEIYTDPNDSNLWLVGRVEPASPADKVGIKENDQIISINFKSIEYYTPEQVTNLLKSENGKTVIVEVFRENKYIVKLLRLKRRI